MKLPYRSTTIRSRPSHVAFPAAVLVFALIPAMPLAAQTDKRLTREIVSEDFTRNRPKATSSATSSSANQKTTPARKRVYRLASSGSKPTGSQPSTQLNNPSLNSIAQQLGVTLWRLRPAQARETGQRMLTRDKDKSSELIPERIEADTLVREGDRLRLTIESPRAGYLYVVDRELYADGSKGQAMLIFPLAGTRDDNTMVAGKLVDIPAEEDDPGYFTASRGRPDQTGELLTLLISSTPMDLPIGTEPLRISAAEIARWEKEWGAETERFELDGGAGEVWTKQEREASSSKGKRQLTHDDPAPQTIYRVSPKDNKAIIVNVVLRYAK